MSRHVLAVFIGCSFVLLGCMNPESIQEQDREVRFVSSPDLFNFDVPDPMPKWDDAVNWYLERVSEEDPDLFLVAGDLVDGRWWKPGRRAIEHMGLIYYEAWTRRMKRHGLRYAPAIGDHEIGDDPWDHVKKRNLVPVFKKVFLNHLDIPGKQMPTDDVVAYYIRMGDVLFITVDTFEKRGREIHLSVTGKQLQWLKDVLNTHGPEADHIIVQGHAPVVGSPASTSSSKLMVENGRSSNFWQLMKKKGVDAYLCGEFHALTTTRKDGIWQIVHGTSWGRKGHVQTYLVGQSTSKGLKLTIKSFPLEVSGEKTWNLNKPGGPREVVQIPEKVRKEGPETVGNVLLQNRDGRTNQLEASGVFNR